MADSSISDSGDNQQLLRKAGQAWSQANQHTPQSRSRWWFHPTVVRHLNRLICGRAVDGIGGGDLDVLGRLSGDGFELGVSIGCGTAFRELKLLRAGVVKKFILYEIAETRIQKAIELARTWGVADRIEFRSEIQTFEKPEGFDLVYWNGSLHHMLDTKKAIAWSRECLLRGGVFYMNDCIGPNRLQYSDEYLNIASEFRAALPERLLRVPGSATGFYPRTAVRLDPLKLAAADPTECADSGSIIPALAECFPKAEVTLLGGVIISCALNDLIANFGESEEDLLRIALLLDERCARQGFSEYAKTVVKF
jgi:SAM-dependent methyltransferase